MSGLYSKGAYIMSDGIKKLNADGLVAGQEVDFTTLMRIKRKGIQHERSEPEATKPKRKAAKASDHK